MAKEETNRAALEVYAHSFYNQLESSKIAEQLHAELTQLEDVLKEADEKEAKEQLKGVLQHLSEVTLQFLSGIGEETPLKDMLAAIEEINQLYEEETEPINVTLTSAVALTEEQKNRIIKSFRKKTGDHHLFIREKVDPAILGGVRLESGNYYYDNTIITKLQEMKDYILKDQ